MAYLRTDSLHSLPAYYLICNVLFNHAPVSVFPRTHASFPFCCDMKYSFRGAIISWIGLYHRYSDDSRRDARKYKLPSPPELTGVLSINKGLEVAKHILEGMIVGPESMVVTDNAIYASLYNGKVVKIVDEQISDEISFTTHKDCGTFQNEMKCGRPLGMRLLKEQKLIVVDAYLGVYLVDFGASPASFSQLFPSSTPIAGRRPMFLNDLDIINDDEIIVSDSSSKHNRQHFMAVMLEQNSNGRLLHHKISTGVTTVLLDKLYFPNGVQLFPDRKSLLFSECSMGRIKRFWLDSKKVETFAGNLPGMPDNIRLSDRGTFWVGLAAPRHSKTISMFDKLGSLPAVRQFLIDIVPSSFWEKILHYVKKPHSMIIEIDQAGNIVRSLHDTTGKYVSDSSQVTPHKNQLYIGSFHSSYIAVVDL